VPALSRSRARSIPRLQPPKQWQLPMQQPQETAHSHVTSPLFSYTKAMFPATVTHVLFDLDGTLTDPYDGITKCVDFALERLGVTRPEGDLHWLIGPPLHESFERLLGTKDEDTVWNAVAIYRERYSTLGKFENVVYSGIPEALARLKAQGLTLFVATSKAEEYAREIVAHFGLDPFFEKVYGSEMDGGNCKGRPTCLPVGAREFGGWFDAYGGRPQARRYRRATLWPSLRRRALGVWVGRGAVWSWGCEALCDAR